MLRGDAKEESVMNDVNTLTRVGRGTPMGELMRQYWIPAIMSSELQADAPPTRVKLLGEELIAFRTTSGKVGIMDHRCPHRGVSLFYGRNEEDGLRCVFHGWKFDAEGRCLDQPNLPQRQVSLHNASARAYRAAERGGVVWIYMGTRDVAPPLPNFPVLSLPQDRLSVWCEQRECNWLQCLEGELDTSHAGFLHMGMANAQTPYGPQGSSIDVLNRAIEYKVADTDYGLLAGGYREADENSLYWRFANFLFPFYTQPPPCALGQEAIARAWVPIDDTHTMLFAVSTDTFVMASGPRAARAPVPVVGMSFDYQFLPNTTDWYGRWRLTANPGNDFLIDRSVQRSASYSGIEGLDVQDAAMQVSMGPIADRSLEYLVPSDLAVARTRRRMLKVLQDFQEKGTAPPGVDQPDAYQAWSGYTTAPKTGDWRKVYEDNLPKKPLA
jgi:phthalate 4,5-dioxygenase oxygenase subunit